MRTKSEYITAWSRLWRRIHFLINYCMNSKDPLIRKKKALRIIKEYQPDLDILWEAGEKAEK